MEDVAENLINTMQTRNERDNAIGLALVETLKRTGGSNEIVVSTMFVVVKNNLESCAEQINTLKLIGRAMIEASMDSEWH